MKKIVIVLFAAIMMMATSAEAFDAPNGSLYGVTTDGVFYVAKSVVDASNGAVPKAMSMLWGWKKEAMVLDGNYYVYKSGKALKAVKVDFCFDVGNNKYIPHALVDDDTRVKTTDVVDNGVGGFNFWMLPK